MKGLNIIKTFSMELEYLNLHFYSYVYIYTHIHQSCRLNIPASPMEHIWVLYISEFAIISLKKTVSIPSNESYQNIQNVVS